MDGSSSLSTGRILMIIFSFYSLPWYVILDGLLLFI